MTTSPTIRVPAWAMLALFWAILPAVPALSQGGFIGHGYTDLYPSVWGMWVFAESQPAFPLHTALLAAPDGMGFYYSSPLHGWMAWPLLPLFGTAGTWNLLLLLNRGAGVAVAYWAGRKWDLGPQSALVAATVYGCSPFFHGYAVEGIAEGQISWTLPLWLGLVAQGRHRWAGIAFGLTVLGSWYMAASACFLAALMPRRSWKSAAAGLILASPAIYAFFGAFPERELLDPSIRRSMGTQLAGWTPGITEGLSPFAKTSWIGFTVAVLACLQCRRSPRIFLAALGFWLLSFGFEWTAEVPLLNSLRFPYRLHAVTLVLLALLAARAVEQRGRAPLWAGAILLEAFLLSPIEPILPHAETGQPNAYKGIEGQQLLDIPGPISMAPGLRNPSRPRSRNFLYGQLEHGMASPWAPDFNSIGVDSKEPDYLKAVRQLDPHWPEEPLLALMIPPEVTYVVVHTKELGNASPLAHQKLISDGWRVDLRDGGDRVRYTR